MKKSQQYWLRSFAWTLLQIGFIMLLFYALSGSFWTAALCTFIIFLIAAASNKSQAYIALARQHQAVEAVRDRESNA